MKRSQPTIDSILNQLRKDELLALVKEMLAQQPDLELLVLLRNKQQVAVDPEVYREQVETAFSSTGADSYDLYNGKMLTSVKRSIDALLKRKEYDGAVVAYEVLIETVLEHLHELAQFEYDYNDEDTLGKLSSFVNDCLENLVTCLEAVTDNTPFARKSSISSLTPTILVLRQMVSRWERVCQTLWKSTAPIRNGLCSLIGYITLLKHWIVQTPVKATSYKTMAAFCLIYNKKFSMILYTCVSVVRLVAITT